MALSDAEILRAVLNNCDPYKPASERFYVDCNAVRGGAVFADKLCTMLSESEGYLHTLFSGHIGGGKSSELEHLAAKLRHRTPSEGNKRFFPVVVNMSEYLDEYDVSATDILVAIVAELGETVRTELGIELKDSYLKKRWEEVKSYLLSDVEINEGEMSWGWGKAKVQRMRTDPTAREKIRKSLFPQTSTLLDEINAAFIEARIALKSHMPRDGGAKYTNFILILDNLEKIQRLADNDQGEASQRALFIESAPQLTALAAHVVFTVPLTLVRSAGNQLSLLYGRELFVLPMIKSEGRGPEHPPFEPGREKLTELLARRMPDGIALTSIMTDDALDAFIYYSGGHVRSLLLFVRETVPYAGGRLPITDDMALTAIGQTAGVLAPSLKPEDWDLLAELELSPRQSWNNHGEAQRRLLENLCVMEYVNGGKENRLQAAVPWYAVNPILREQYAFEDAVEAQKKAPPAPRAGEG